MEKRRATDCGKLEFDSDCPYIEQIQTTHKDVQLIKQALIGDLATKLPGLIEDVRAMRLEMRQQVKKKWSAKDYSVCLLGIAALITATAAFLGV